LFAPLAASTVHFVGFDSLRAQFELSGVPVAEPERDQTYIDIEPTTGRACTVLCHYL